MVIKNEVAKPMTMRDVISLFVGVGRTEQKKPPDVEKDKDVTHKS